MAENRVTQEYLEVGYRTDPPVDNARVTQEYLEVAYRVAPPVDNARLTQMFVEVGYRDPLILDIVGGDGETVPLPLEFRMGLSGGLQNVVDIVSGDTYCHPRDLLVVLDHSTSMDLAYGAGTRMEAAQAAMHALLDTMAASDTDSYAGLITFSWYYNDGFGLEGDAAELADPPGITNDWTALGTAVDAVGTGGFGTPTAAAIAYARSEMEAIASGRPDSTKCIVVVTDGEWNLGTDPVLTVQSMVAAHPGWLFYVVDVNDGAANPSNVNLGNSGSGFFSASDVEDLTAALLQAGDPCGVPVPLDIPVTFGLALAPNGFDLMGPHYGFDDCGQYLGPRECEIRLYDDENPASGRRKDFGSEGGELDAAVSELSFEIQERGGYGSGSCELLAGWDEVSLAGTERIDVWLWDAPAYRGYLRVPERHIDSPESATLTLYGMVAILDGYQVRHKIAYGCPTDITVFFRDLALAYVKQTGRFPGITIEASAPVGVTLKEFDARGSSVPEAFNRLCDLAPAQVIWGVEMDTARPIPGDTLYMRPRPTTVAYVYAIGDNVRAFTYPVDTDEIQNRLIIEGGPVDQPNRAENGGFESLKPASEEQGNLLLNESFEDRADPTIHWTLTGPDPTVQTPGGSGASGSARTGDHWLELDEASEAASQTVSVVPGRAYTAVCWARLESSAEPNAFTLTLEGLNVSDVAVTTVYATFNSASTPALDSAVYHRYTVEDDWTGVPSVVKARITVTAGGGSHADDGVLIDDLGIYETCGNAQETWRIIPTGNATIVDLDWDSTGTATTPPRSGGLCVHVRCDGISVSADTGEFYYLPSKSPSVEPRERYTFALWWHADGQGTGAETALTIGAVSIDSSNNQGTVWESSAVIGNPSTWQMARLDIMTESTTARLQLFIRVRTERDVYLDDVMLVQGEAPAEVELYGGFWTAETYERAIDVENPALTGMLDAGVADSITLYGEREATVSNNLVTDRDTMLAFASGQFNANALPKVQARLEIAAARELLAQVGKVRLINLPAPPPALWPARASYRISAASIDISAELGNRRPDLQSLLALTAQRG